MNEVKVYLLLNKLKHYIGRHLYGTIAPGWLSIGGAPQKAKHFRLECGG